MVHQKLKFYLLSTQSDALALSITRLEVCEEEEVLELDAQSLGDLLASDDLNISQEQVVLELVLRWVERRRGDLQSEAKAVELLRRVRLELVDPGFLRKARRRNPVRDAPGETSSRHYPQLSMG